MTTIRRWGSASRHVVHEETANRARTLRVIVTFGDAGGELAKAPGSWSGIEGSLVFEEPPAGPIRADPKRGGQKAHSLFTKTDEEPTLFTSVGN
jgi:hypothetical protein